MAGDTSLPSKQQEQEQEHYKDDDLIAELTHHMDRFLLQDNHDDDDDHIFDFSSSTHSHNSQLSWDLMGSPQSTLWSPLPSEASSQEPSPPPTPGTTKGLCSYQSLIQDQIRAIELSRLKQEQILSMKIESEDKEHNNHDESLLCKEKKGKGSSGGGGFGRRNRPPPRPAPLVLQQPQQCGGAMRALFLGSSASRGGTGVFLPRAAAANATTPPPQSTTKQGNKGCSTVLIPARVVQALQQHFDQMAATAGPKAAAAFPPLHDVIVNANKDGIYLLEKRQSREAPPIQNEMILPQEWTY